MQISTYLKEAGYALRTGIGWRDRLLLLQTTARFHLNNFRNRPARNTSPISLDITIGDTARRISVRPLSGDIFILYEVLAFEAYRLNQNRLNPHSIQTIIDCGANIGLTALYFASKYPNARIISIEPDPANFALLKKNVEQEPRITPIFAALVGVPTEVVYLSQDRPAWGNAIRTAPGQNNAVKVPAITIDQLARRFDLGKIDLLKVDVEGAEKDIFAKPEFLSNVRFIAIELHRNYAVEHFRRDIDKMGFDAKLPEAGNARVITAFPRA